jgi:hypothetical protein
MSIVAPPQRLASAAVVCFGQHGAITRQAQQRDVSRQRLYREADSVLRDLDSSHLQQENARLQQQVAYWQTQATQLQTQRPLRVLIDTDKQAEFACTAQAEGVSLPVARRLLAVLLRDLTPSVATLGRFSQQAGQRAASLLTVLDEHARPQARQVGADEIFFAAKPVLMVVEPESLCWLSGRLAPSRDGEQWAREFEQLPALEHVARDGAKGIANGLARVNQQRTEQQKKPIGDQVDHFHTLREGRRALRKTQGQAETAWSKAEAADQAVARQDRQGQSLAGYVTQATRKWQKAEQAFYQWEKAEQALEQIRQALQPFTAEGALNTREQARQRVEELLPQLCGDHWDKFKRQVRQPETYTYLDNLKEKIEQLPVSAEVREAVVHSAGIRHNPDLVQGEGKRAAVLRGFLVVWSVLIAQAGEKGQQAVAALRQALRCVGRASSCVEGLNSVVRMQQGRHRKMTQGLLDLKRLYWNLRTFRTGRRRKTTPYERLGVPVPAELSWWQLLHLTPEQLRTRLLAQSPPSHSEGSKTKGSVCTPDHLSGQPTPP